MFISEDHTHIPNALSVSQINTFLRCRKQWWYGYKLLLSPKRVTRGMSIGKMCHEAFAAAWRFKVENPNSTIRVQILAGDLVIDQEFAKYLGGVTMMEEEMPVQMEFASTAHDVFARAYVAFNPDNWEPLITQDGTPMVEVHFLDTLIPGHPIQGYIDLVAREKDTGYVWQIDYKFQSTLGDESEEIFNVQNATYQYILMKMGYPVVGSYTFQFINAPVTMPSINKNGSISRAVIRCTWPIYSWFCMEHGQDPSLYEEDMIPKFDAIRWYKPIFEYRNAATLKAMWKEIVQGTAYEITKKQTRYPRSLSPMTCRMCSFINVCNGELRGYDTDAMIAHDFVRKDAVAGIVEMGENNDGEV